MSTSLFEPSALFITFREAVEAGVIISVALAFLRKTDQMHLKPQGKHTHAASARPRSVGRTRRLRSGPAAAACAGARAGAPLSERGGQRLGACGYLWERVLPRPPPRARLRRATLRLFRARPPAGATSRPARAMRRPLQA